MQPSLRINSCRDRSGMFGRRPGRRRRRRAFRIEPLEPRIVLDSTVVFNEAMYHPPGLDSPLEWVELYNQMAVDVDVSGWSIEGIGFTFGDSAVIPGGGYAVIAADPIALATETGFGGAMGPFGGQLSNSGEPLRLLSNNGRVMDTLDYGDSGFWPVAPDGSGATLAKIDPDTGSAQVENWTFSEQVNGTPGAPNFAAGGDVPTVAINEISPGGDAQFRVELKNFGPDPVQLDGLVLGSSIAGVADFVLPPGTLPAGGYTTLDAATLGLTAFDGDRLFLYTPDRSAVVDAALVKNRLRARLPEGTGPWLFADAPTFDAANDAFTLQDDVVINEIMYNGYPDRGGPGIPAAENGQEWIELFNRGSQTADLSGWQLDGGIGFTFPLGTSLGAGQYLVVARDAAALAAQYPAITVAGEFNGRLANSGELIVLTDAAGNPADSVRYFDNGNWPLWADGGGSSLELIDPRADNSRASAWAASDEAADSPWQTYTYRGTAVDDGIGNNVFYEFVLGLLDEGQLLLDDVSVIENPDTAPIQVIQNGGFEADALGQLPDAWRLIGNHGYHGKSVVVDDPDTPGNKVLRLVATGNTDGKHNQASTTFAGGRTITVGTEYEISFRAKWLGGSNQVNTRLYFNYLQTTTLLDVPADNGTPGTANSRLVANAGPALANLVHDPVVPNAGQSVTVSATADDPDGVATMTLRYRVDPGTWADVPMAGDGTGTYTGAIPGQTAGAVVQFYVVGQDTSGATSSFPVEGEQSRRLYQVYDGRANLTALHNVRIIMTAADRDRMYGTTGDRSFDSHNRMSNDRIGATVVYDERTVYYDVGVRLKGSGWGRNSDPNAGFNIEFQRDNLFRGVHRTIAIERASNKKELLAKHMLGAAGGSLAGMYDDVAYIITPRPGDTGVGLLAMARYSSVFLDSQYDNGADGPLYNMELLYSPFSTIGDDPENEKIYNPYTHANGSFDISDLGDDKEAYRWNFQLRNNRDKDDFGPMIALGQAFELAGTALDERTQEIMDVDQWMRTFAMMSLNGNDDFYTRSWNHNFRMYQRPEDGKMLALPWDLDRAFQLPYDSPLWGQNNVNLQKVIELPANKRLYYGHLLDIINTTANTGYMGYWTEYYGQLTGQNFSGVLSYIGSRSAFVRSQLPSEIPFTITTADDITVEQPVAVLEGDGWINVREIFMDGLDAPLAVTWTDEDSWQLTVPIEFGQNVVRLEAFDHQGNSAGTDTITVTGNARRSLREQLRISELMYNPGAPSAAERTAGFIDNDDFEFIELFNTGPETLDLTGLRFTDGVVFDFADGSVTTLDAGEYLVLARNAGAMAARYGTLANLAGEYGGGLKNSSERIELADAFSQPVQTFTYDDAWYSITDGTGFSLRVRADSIPDVGAWSDADRLAPSSIAGGSPGAADPEATVVPGGVAVNEVLAHSDGPEGDWIELVNTTGEPVDVGNWYLSDSASTVAKYVIPAGTVIPPGDMVVFNQRDHFGQMTPEQPLNPGSIVPFGLSEHGEEVSLVGADASGSIIGFQTTQPFGASEAEVSFGRYTTSTGRTDFVPMATQTPNGPNGLPAVGPVVINEIMYHPADGGTEFIELLNVSDQTVPLYDPANPTHVWRFTRGVSFSLPAGVELAAGERALVVPEQPAVFRAAHGIDPSVQIFGPYSGVLDNGGEQVELSKPGEVNAGLFFSYVVADRIRYDDEAPWPGQTDGSGPSLERIVGAEYGNDPANWRGGPSGGTPGRPNEGPDQTPPTAPSGLTGTFTGLQSIELHWNAATDPESGIGGYRLYRDGVDVGGSATTTVVDAGISGGTPSTYWVTAVNADGLEGPRSEPLRVAMFQDGGSPDAAYAGTDDATILEGDPSGNTGGISPVVLTPDFPAGDQNLAVVLLRWDLAGLPVGTALESAALTLSIESGLAVPFEIYEIKREWVESEVTFSEFSDGQAWQTAGAAGPLDRGSALLGTAEPSGTGQLTVALNAAGLALAQSWIDDPAGNHGLILLPTGGRVAGGGLPDGAPLLAMYDFDGDAGDDSGNGLDGTPANVTFTTGSGGFEGEAAVLAGNTGSYIDLPIDVGVTAVPQMTWGAWVRPSALGTTEREIFSTDNGGFDRVLTIDKRNGTAGDNPLQFAAFAGASGVLRSTAPTLPELDQWRFVAATYDQTSRQVRLFVEENGSLAVDQTTSNIGASLGFVRVGMHAGGVNQPFAGLIDNVFIFGEVLSTEQLERIRAGGADEILSLGRQRTERDRLFYQQQVLQEPSLISYYTFDDDTPAAVADVAPDDPHDSTSITGSIAFDAGVHGSGQSLLLDGSSKVGLGVIDDFNFPDGTGTVEAWIRADWIAAPGSNPAWFAVRDGGGTRYSLHALGNGRSRVAHWNNSTVLWADTPLGNDWHHVVSTVDAAGRKFYVDGNLIGTDAQGLVGPTGKPAWIGASTAGTTEPWVGAIDELAIYDDVLDAETIVRHGQARDVQQVWDFESGTMDGWTAVTQPHGDDLAFSVAGNQPVAPSGFDTSTIQGSRIVRTWQLNVSGNSDLHTGIAQTDPFVLGSGARFDFLVGGGPHLFTGDPDAPDADITAFNLERQVAPGDWEMIFTASGNSGNYLLPGVWDASDYVGQTVRLRIYDTHTGGWGWIGVDDVRYSTSPPVEPATPTMNVASSESTAAGSRPQLGLVFMQPADVMGRFTFYNNSAFDGGDAVADARDDAAVATDKSALLPGQSATSSNYTSYAGGINGIMIDVERLARPDLLSTADFRFRVGNVDDVGQWQPPAEQPQVVVRPGAGTGGSDRVMLGWSDTAVRGAWLEVAVLATTATGLAEPDVFYFGNATGETGNDAADTLVNAADVVAVRDHPRGPLNPAAVDNLFDFNRDRQVDALDMILARDNATSPLSALRPITPTAPSPSPRK